MVFNLDGVNIFAAVVMIVAAVVSILVLIIIGYCKMKRIQSKHSERMEEGLYDRVAQIRKSIRKLKKQKQISEDRIKILEDQDDDNDHETELKF
jgi:hypothetical protein